MAQYNGYVSVPHSSYQEWRDATLGNGYNVDRMFGNQCWDFCALLYWQYGHTLQTGNGYAYGCWTLRKDANSVPPFVAINYYEEIKRGDIIVLNRGGRNTTGHIAFADEDYNGTGYIKMLGQNQGGVNGNVNVANSSLSRFLGVFRNINWETSPTPPTPTRKKKKKFPWAIAWANWDSFKH